MDVDVKNKYLSIVAQFADLQNFYENALNCYDSNLNNIVEGKLSFW